MAQWKPQQETAHLSQRMPKLTVNDILGNLLVLAAEYVADVGALLDGRRLRGGGRFATDKAEVVTVLLTLPDVVVVPLTGPNECGITHSKGYDWLTWEVPRTHQNQLCMRKVWNWIKLDEKTHRFRIGSLEHSTSTVQLILTYTAPAFTKC